MSNILWGMKYSVYPFEFTDSAGVKKVGQIIVYDKGGAVVSLDGEEQHFKNFQKAMQFVTIGLLKSF